MNISITGKVVQKKDLLPAVKEANQFLRIGMWRDGGYGDSFFGYAVAKAIKDKYTNSSIEFLSPSPCFIDIFRNNSFCKLTRGSYGSIYSIQSNFKKYYDIWFYLRPASFMLYNPDNIQSEEIKGELKEIMDRQVSIYGHGFTINQNCMQGQIIGGGDVYVLDICNWLFNLDANFKTVAEPIRSSYGFRSVSQHLSDKFNLSEYFTVHQWAWVGREDNSYKFWPLAYWGELARLLKNEYDFPIIQLGGSKETKLPDPIDISALGRYDFMQSAGIIARGLMHIDIEGSLTHVAAALDHPCVSICGPSAKYWRHPWAKSVSYISADPSVCDVMPCETKVDGGSFKCPREHHKCLTTITPEQVFEEIKRRLR